MSNRLLQLWRCLPVLLFCYATHAQTFVPTGSLNQARISNTITLLQNGMVLVTGGGNGPNVLNTAELYNPQTGTWRYTKNPMNIARYGSAAALMHDGRVLIIGGANASSFLSSVEIFDPATETFTITGSLNLVRGFPLGGGAVTLQDGRVLAIAGSSTGTATATVEAYNPQQGIWSYVGPLSLGLTDYSLTLLPNGSVLVAGGCNGLSCPPAYTAVELFNPITNTWKDMAPLLLGRVDHTATLLPDGTVLIAGGFPNFSTTTSTEIYNPAAVPNGASRWGPAMNVPRRHHTATLTPGGSVLVAGGLGDSAPSYSSAELLTNVNSSWTLVGPMTTPRQDHTATLLSSGAVLIATGVQEGNNNQPLSSAELWGTTTPGCFLPQNISIDDSKSKPFISATKANQTFQNGNLIADINFVNNLRFWMGVGNIAASSPPPFLTPSFLPNPNGAVEDLAAKGNLIIPCKSGASARFPYLNCQSPGGSAWTVGFCGPGTVQLSLQVTLSAVELEVMDLAMGILPTPVNFEDLLYMEDQLQTVPLFSQVTHCFTDVGQYSGSTFTCFTSAIGSLINNDSQIAQMTTILQNNGITFSGGLKAVLINAITDPLSLTSLSEKITDWTRLMLGTGLTGKLQLTVTGK